MRSIIQGKEPAALRSWKRANRTTTQNLFYENIPGPVLKLVKHALLMEQKGLCAYTLQRLTDIQTLHLEHIEPQNQQPQKSIDYSNMAVCFPSDGGDISHGYGAPMKGGQAVQLNENFVSPHSKGCEKRFIFTSDGKISSVQNDQAAKQTIETLHLDCSILNELRQRALAANGLTINPHSLRVKQIRLSATEATRLAKNVMEPNSNGLLDPFCTAIAQVAKAYAQSEKKRSQRKRKVKR
jgi:uncharacterized protein (TIGR02646 family)